MRSLSVGCKVNAKSRESPGDDNSRFLPLAWWVFFYLSVQGIYHDICFFGVIVNDAPVIFD